MRARLFVMALLLGASASLGFAASPTRVFSFQGVLRNPSGTPYDGSVMVTFTLYDSRTNTNRWTETKTVLAKNGVYSTSLGDTPGFLFPDTLLFDGALDLGVKVGSDPEMTPRIRLLSAPYSLMAASIMGGAVTAAKISDGAVITSKIRDGMVTAAKISKTDVTACDSLTFDGANFVWGNPKASSLALPYTDSVNSPSTLLSITNSGTVLSDNKYAR